MSAETGERKEQSWSANLETEEYADDPERIVEDALAAVERTSEGTHVNLVTHGEQGHPREYLYPVLAERLGEGIEWEFVDRCGCGGYVTRVYK